MVVEDRKRKKYGKATWILSIALGADILSMAVVSRSSFTGLVMLSTGKISIGSFVILDVVGAAAALFTAFLLRKFKHFSKVSFSTMCGFAIFFGLTLPMMQLILSPNSWISLVTVEGALALALAGAAMVLSIFSA